MRNLPAAPREAFSEMLNAIADYTNDRLPWEPTGPDTTYVAAIRIDELTTLYAVPDEMITDSQRAILALADRTYLPLYLLDETVPPGILGADEAQAGGEHGAAALRVVSWHEGTGDLWMFFDLPVDTPHWTPTDEDLAAEAAIWGEYFAASFNPQKVSRLNGKPTAFVRIAMESMESG
jgi:hypothetical protein